MEHHNIGVRNVNRKDVDSFAYSNKKNIKRPATEEDDANNRSSHDADNNSSNSNNNGGIIDETNHPNQEDVVAAKKFKIDSSSANKINSPAADCDITKKSLISALKNNIGKSIGVSIANSIVEISNHSFLLNENFNGSQVFSTSDNKNEKTCVGHLNELFKELKAAHEGFANFLVSNTSFLTDLYTRDIGDVVKMAILKENLFNNSGNNSIISRGLVKFDTIIDLSRFGSLGTKSNINRSDALNMAIASSENENSRGNASEALNQLYKFKEYITTVFCPRVIQILITKDKLTPVNAMAAFSEIVKYVERYNSLSNSLPGAKFRALLVDINIKLIESDMTLDNSSDTSKRNLIKALKTVCEQKPISEYMSSRLDTASDIIVLPNSSELAKVPLPPSSLLLITNYLNDMLSLEKLSVFTQGTFKSICITITQCIAGTSNGETEKSVGGGVVSRRQSVAGIGGLASKLAKKDIVDSLIVFSKRNKGKKKKKGKSIRLGSNGNKKKCKTKHESDNSGSSSDDDDDNNKSSGGEDEEEGGGSAAEEENNNNNESSEDESGDEEERRRSKNNDNMINIVSDDSLITSELRRLTSNRNYKKMIDFIRNTISDSKNSQITCNYMISALTDALVVASEERDSLKHKLRHYCASSSLNNSNNTEDEKLPQMIESVIKDLADPSSDKSKVLTFMLSDVDRTAILKHESVLFGRRLIPSNCHNDIDTVITSFFQKNSNDNDKNFCSNTNLYPRLDEFVKIITGQASMLVTSFNSVVNIPKSYEKERIRKLKSINASESNSAAMLSIDDKLESNNQQSQSLMDNIRPMGSDPRRYLKSKLHAVISVSSSASSLLLYPDKLEGGGSSSDAYAETIRWRNLVSQIETSKEAETLRSNAASVSNDSALSEILFPWNDTEEGESKHLAVIVDSLFYLIDVATAIVDGTNTSQDMILILDDKLLNKIVHYLYYIFNSVASAMYNSAIKRNSLPFKSSNSSNESNGSENASDVASESVKKEGECPSVFERRRIATLSEYFLKKVNKLPSKQQQELSSPSSSRNIADRDLIKEISSRSSDIVKSQLANVVASVVVLNTSMRISEQIERRVESMSENQQDIPVGLLAEASYAQHPNVRSKIKGLKKTVSRLSVFIGLSAAVDMLRLSNSYFFSVVGQPQNNNKEGLNYNEQKYNNNNTGGEQRHRSSQERLKTALKNSLIGSVSGGNRTPLNQNHNSSSTFTHKNNSSSSNLDLLNSMIM